VAYLYWMSFAIVSTFIQCSFFNYYQLAYLEELGIDRLSSKKDEVHRQDLEKISRTGKPALRILRFFYLIIYGWQDRFVAHIDKWLYKSSRCGSAQAWYGDRNFMILQSPLCFGTQIFVIIVSAISGRPEYSLIAIAGGMNIYLVLVLLLRRFHFAVQPLSGQAA
jgi:hypothetical protein